MSQLSNFEKLNLILWKNRLVLYYHWKHLLCCLCSPIFFALLLVMLRVSLVPHREAVLQFDPIDLGNEWRKLITLLEQRTRKLDPLPFNCFMPRIAIAYAPNTTDFVNEIMNKARADHLYDIDLVQFATTAELQEAMINKHYLVGVKFELDDNEINTPTVNYPNSLSFSLVYPSELRMWDSAYKIGESWHTHELFDSLSTRKRRNAQQPDGGFVGYVREGFASVQNAISLAFIMLKTNASLPQVTLQRFPFKADSEDELVEDEKNDVAFVVVMGFLYPVIFISVMLNREKEKNINVFFQIMGINYGIQMLAWFIDSFLILITATLIYIAALKIHWCDGFAILTTSSWIAVLFLFIAFNMASISFAFMVMSFFDRTVTAILSLIVLWIITIFPCALLYPFRSLAIQLIVCIFSNSCMFIAMKEILKYEYLGDGYQWANFFVHDSVDSKISIGGLTVLLYALTFIYALIGLGSYYWSKYLVRLRHKIPIAKMCCNFRWFSRSSEIESTVLGQRRLSPAFEVSPNFKKIWVDIRNLTKIYHNRTVVNDLNLSLFQNEIMVLMGHNGCGKTTLLSMITGLVKPTKGTVMIGGFSTAKEPDRAFEDIGLCLQEDFLIPELNVSNQLLLHCRMKGLSYEFLESDVDKYLTAMNIYENRDQITGEMSIGLKKFLSACCALCGGSKFVVLDEPESGMDSIIRKKFRDILLQERMGRTILMTTHSTAEADCISDRISIMSGGVLKCFGTSTFLRSVYCNGFNLVCKKDDHCDSNLVTDALQKLYPIRLIPESDIGTELSYRLDRKYSRNFSAILDYMEQNYAKLNIVSVSIGEASIEDVFLSMGVENTSRGNRERRSSSLNGTLTTQYIEEEKNLMFLKKTEKYKGLRLLKNQWKTLLLRHLICDMRMRPMAALRILTPLLLTALSFPIETRVATRQPLPTMTYRLSQYPESVTVVDIREDISLQLIPRIIASYEDLIMSMGVAHKIFETVDYIFTEQILDLQAKQQNDVNRKFLIAVSFKHDELKVWFNNYPLHTVPLTLNVMHTAILRAVTNDTSASITVSYEPLPFATRNYIRWYFNGRVLAIALTFCLSILWSVSIMNLVREHQNNYKFLQYTHCVRPSAYWQTVFVYDSIWIITISLALMLVMLPYERQSIIQLESIVAYFSILVMVGLLLLPFNYALVKIFKDDLTAFCTMIIISIYGCTLFIASMNEHEYQLPWLFLIIPYYSLSSILFKIYHFARIKLFCKDEIFKKISMTLEGCEVEPNCCSEHTAWHWSKFAILPEVVSIVALSVCSLIILVVLELRDVNKAGIFNQTIPKDDIKAEEEDYRRWHSQGDYYEHNSMEQEQFRIANLKPKEYLDKPLILKAVGNNRKTANPLHRIFLVVNRSECLGVFGTGFSGKTAFMKMLVDNKASSYGEIYVNGLSLRTQLYEVYDRIGYCQQISTNLDIFYASEVLNLLCNMHGIPQNEITSISEGIAKAFGYWSHYRYQIKYYTPGIKRRFRISLALIGNPAIVYLDEPMIGLDLEAIRRLSYIICRFRDTGSSILFTSLRFWISEIFCSRLSFLYGGRLSHLGTPYELYRQFFKGYMLKLKIKTTEFAAVQLGSTDAIFLPNPFLKVQSFVEMTFPNAIMKEQRGRLMYFLIPKQNIKISFIFEELIRNEFILNIETFHVSSNTLSMFYFDSIERHNASQNH